MYGIPLPLSPWMDIVMLDGPLIQMLNDQHQASIVFLDHNPISWQPKKQSLISRSSTETKYRSLAPLVAEITWISSLLTELHFPLPRPPVAWCDNLSVVLLSANPIQHTRRKHLQLDLYFVQEKVLHGHLVVKNVHVNRSKC